MITTGCLNGSIPQYSSSDSLWACRGASNDAVLVGNNLGTGYDQPALPNCTDAAGNHLNYTATTNNFTCGTTTSGTGAPGGASGDVQFAAGTAFGGTSGVSWDNAAMRFAAGVSLDMSGVPNSALAGLKTPLALGSVANVSADGQIIWRTSDDILFVGTGTSTKPVGGAGFLMGLGNLTSLTATFSCTAAGGGCAAEATAAENITRMQYTGTWKNFRITLGTAPGGLTAWFCTSKIANVAGNQACSIIGAATGCQDFVSTDAVRVNQTIGYTCTAQGVVAATTGQSITSIFVPTENAING